MSVIGAAPGVSTAPGKLWSVLPSGPSWADRMRRGPVPIPHITKAASALVPSVASITRPRITL